jgi:hypothetical protein
MADDPRHAQHCAVAVMLRSERRDFQVTWHLICTRSFTLRARGRMQRKTDAATSFNPLEPTKNGTVFAATLRSNGYLTDPLPINDIYQE